MTIESEHFRVTFTPGLERLAAHAAVRAEAARTRLAARFLKPPREPIDIVLCDPVDFSNGYASPVPANHVVIYAQPPVGDTSLGFHEDWLDTVLIHELTHIFHLDATGRPGSLVRGVFGRVPMAWPAFPALGVPGWNIEGTAVYFESAFTGYGRLRGTYHEMVLRAAVLERAFDPIDRAGPYTPIWPGAERRYIYGSLFMEHLAGARGPAIEGVIARQTADAGVPPSLAFDRVGRRTLGLSFTRAWDDWRAVLTARQDRLADSLRAAGLTATERLTARGHSALHPRVSPDGRHLAYACADGITATTTRVLSLAEPPAGGSKNLHRRTSLGTNAWFPGSDEILISQLEYRDRYHITSDLFAIRMDGRERRLTRGLRLQDPDLAPGGRTVAAVENGGGTNRLVLVDLPAGVRRPLTPADPGVNWATPRWSPDGTLIAAARWEGGRLDIAVLDTTGALLALVTRDSAMDTAPAWTPDGRTILFSSDRTGIPNLFAATFEDSITFRREQVTNLLTGAFTPDVSPDGRWIYFAGYHADGFHLERIPLDRAQWRSPAPARTTAVVESRTDGEERAGATPVATPYSPLPTVLPRFWLPLVEGNELTGWYYGLATSGQDLIARHLYAATAAFTPEKTRLRGTLSYSYAGLGQPVLNVRVSRFWDAWRSYLEEDAPPRRIDEREDALLVGSTLLRARMRSSAAVTLWGEHVRRRRSVEGGRDSLLADRQDRLWGLIGDAQWGNARRYPFSISTEDGIRARLTGRRRWDVSAARFDDGYWEARSALSAYRGFPVFGFAHHVLAGRLSGLWRTGPGAGNSSLGGPSGSSLDLIVTRVGGGSTSLPLRGFRHGVRSGSRAWTGSMEYRFPLALVGRGYRLWPLFLDRISAAVFLDAGDGWCRRRDGRYRRCGEDAGPAGPLLGAGAEAVLDLVLATELPLRLRGGAGLPVRGPGGPPRWYVALGESF